MNRPFLPQGRCQPQAASMKYSGLSIRLLLARSKYHCTISAVNSNHDACHVWPRDDVENICSLRVLVRVGQLTCRYRTSRDVWSTHRLPLGSWSVNRERRSGPVAMHGIIIVASKYQHQGVCSTRNRGG